MRLESEIERDAAMASLLLSRPAPCFPRSPALASTRSPFLVVLGGALAGAIAAGCASHGAQRPDENPSIVAAVDAQARVVASESTWVTHGPGYQLVALSKRDIAAVDSSVAHQSKMYDMAFGAVPPEVIVLITRVSSDRNAQQQAATPALPAGTTQQVVDVRLTDGAADNGNTQNRGRGVRGGYGGYGGRGGGGYGGNPGNGDYGARGRGDGVAGALGDPAQAVTRAWLSARATSLTGRAATVGANGQTLDPRVPVWAEALVPVLAADDTTIQNLATQLAAQPESLYALRDFFTMTQPGTGPRTGRSAQNAGRAGGMGGGRAGRGRGGDARQGLLGGRALFTAQATVLGKYLSLRQGTPLIGQLVDGQIRGKKINDLLAAQPSGPKDVEWLDTDWREWLRQYAPGGH